MRAISKVLSTESAQIQTGIGHDKLRPCKYYLNYHFNVFGMPVYLSTGDVYPNLMLGHPQILKSETTVHGPHLLFRQILFLF
jgi:hypothetical protein